MSDLNGNQAVGPTDVMEGQTTAPQPTAATSKTTEITNGGLFGFLKKKTFKAGSKINQLADILAKRSQFVVEVSENGTDGISSLLVNPVIESEKTEIEPEIRPPSPKLPPSDCPGPAPAASVDAPAPGDVAPSTALDSNSHDDSTKVNNVKTRSSPRNKKEMESKQTDSVVKRGKTKKLSRRSRQLVEMSTQTADIEFISIRTSSENDPFVCLYCHQTFSEKRDCKAHELTHAQKRKTKFIKCQFCSKKLPNLDEMKNHASAMHRDCFHLCVDCDVRFISDSKLTEHLEKDHADPKMEPCSTLKKMKQTSSSFDLESNFDASKKSTSPRHVQKSCRTEEQIFEAEMLFYSHLSGNIQENLSNHLDGKIDRNDAPTDGPETTEGRSKPGNSLAVPATTNGATPSPIIRAPSPYQTRSKTPNPLPTNAKKFKKLPNWQQKFWQKYNFPANYRFEHRFWDKNYFNTEKSALYLKDLSCLDIKTQLTLRENASKLEQKKPQKNDLEVKDSFMSYLNLFPGNVTQNSDSSEATTQPLNVEAPTNAKKGEKGKVKLARKCKQVGETQVVTRRKTGSDNGRQRKGSLDMTGKDKMTLRRQTSLEILDTRKESSPTEDIPKDVEETRIAELEPSVITGEWVRPRSYLCGTCCEKFTNLWELEDHKWKSHPNVWCWHYEFEDEKLEKLFKLEAESPQVAKIKLPDLYRRTLGPKGSLGTTEVIAGTSFPHVCTKCEKSCQNQSDLHKHLLDCGGDTTWSLTMHMSPGTMKRKWKPFGGKRRKQIRRRGLKRTIPATPTLRTYCTQPKIRTKPGDVESIQKMLANLPEKRTRRAINFDEISTRSQATIHSNRLLRKRFNVSFGSNFLRRKALKTARQQQQKQQSVGSSKLSSGSSSKTPSDISEETTPSSSPRRRQRLQEVVEDAKSNAVVPTAKVKIVKKKPLSTVKSDTKMTKNKTKTPQSNKEVNGAPNEVTKDVKKKALQRTDLVKKIIKKVRNSNRTTISVLRQKKEDIRRRSSRINVIPIKDEPDTLPSVSDDTQVPEIVKEEIENPIPLKEKAVKKRPVKKKKLNKVASLKKKTAPDVVEMPVLDKVEPVKTRPTRKSETDLPVLKPFERSPEPVSTELDQPRFKIVKKSKKSIAKKKVNKVSPLKIIKRSEIILSENQSSATQETVVQDVPTPNSAAKPSLATINDSESDSEPLIVLQRRCPEPRATAVKRKINSKIAKKKGAQIKKVEKTSVTPESLSVDASIAAIVQESIPLSPPVNLMAKVLSEKPRKKKKEIAGYSRSKKLLKQPVKRVRMTVKLKEATLKVLDKPVRAPGPNKWTVSVTPTEPEIRFNPVQEAIDNGKDLEIKKEVVPDPVIGENDLDDKDKIVQLFSPEVNTSLPSDIPTEVNVVKVEDSTESKVPEKAVRSRKAQRITSENDKPTERKRVTRSVVKGANMGSSKNIKAPRRKSYPQSDLSKVVTNDPEDDHPLRELKEILINNQSNENESIIVDTSDTLVSTKSISEEILEQTPIQTENNSVDETLTEKDTKEEMTNGLAKDYTHNVSELVQPEEEQNGLIKETKCLKRRSKRGSKKLLEPVPESKEPCSTSQPDSSILIPVEVATNVAISPEISENNALPDCLKSSAAINNDSCKSKNTNLIDVSSPRETRINKKKQSFNDTIPTLCDDGVSVVTTESIYPSTRRRSIIKAEKPIEIPVADSTQHRSSRKSEENDISSKNFGLERSIVEATVLEETVRCVDSKTDVLPDSAVSVEEVKSEIPEVREVTVCDSKIAEADSSGDVLESVPRKRDVEENDSRAIIEQEGVVSSTETDLQNSGKKRMSSKQPSIRLDSDDYNQLEELDRRSRRRSKEIPTTSEFIIDDPLILVDELWSELDSDSDSKQNKKKPKRNRKRVTKKRSIASSRIDLEALLRNFGENKDTPTEQNTIKCLPKRRFTENILTSRQRIEKRLNCSSSSVYRRLSLRLFSFNKKVLMHGHCGKKLLLGQVAMSKIPLLPLEVTQNPEQVIVCRSTKNRITKKQIKLENNEEINHIRVSLPLELLGDLSILNNNHPEASANLDLPKPEVQSRPETPDVKLTEPKTKRSEVIDKIFYCEICNTYYYSPSQLKIHKMSNRHKLKEQERSQGSSKSAVNPLEPTVSDDVVPSSAESAELDVEKTGDDTSEMPVLEGPFIETRKVEPPMAPALQPTLFGFTPENLKEIQKAIGCSDEEMLLLTLFGENDLADVSNKADNEIRAKPIPDNKTNGLLKLDLKQRMTSALASLLNRAVKNLLNKSASTMKADAADFLSKLSDISNRRKPLLTISDGESSEEINTPSPSLARYKYQCTICGNRFEKESTRDNHLIRTHRANKRPKTQQKPPAEQLTPPSEDWNDSWFDNEEPFALGSSQFWCSDCGINFLSPAEVREHQQLEHPPERVNVNTDVVEESSKVNKRITDLDPDQERLLANQELQKLKCKRYPKRCKASKTLWGRESLKFQKPGEIAPDTQEKLIATVSRPDAPPKFSKIVVNNLKRKTPDDSPLIGLDSSLKAKSSVDVYDFNDSESEVEPIILSHVRKVGKSKESSADEDSANSSMLSSKSAPMVVQDPETSLLTPPDTDEAKSKISELPLPSEDFPKEDPVQESVKVSLENRFLRLDEISLKKSSPVTSEEEDSIPLVLISRREESHKVKSVASDETPRLEDSDDAINENVIYHSNDSMTSFGSDDATHDDDANKGSDSDVSSVKADDSEDDSSLKRSKKKIVPLLTATLTNRSSEKPKDAIVKRIWNRQRSKPPSEDEESQSSGIDKETIMKRIWKKKRIDVENEEAARRHEEVKINQTEISDEVVIRCGPKPRTVNRAKSTNETQKGLIVRRIWNGKFAIQTKAALKTYDTDIITPALPATPGKRRGRPSSMSNTKRKKVVSASEDDLDSLLDEIERENVEKAIRSEFLHMRRTERSHVIESPKDPSGLFAESQPAQSKITAKKRRKLGKNIRIMKRREELKIRNRKHKKHRHRHHHHKHKHKKSKHHKRVLNKHRERRRPEVGGFKVLERMCEDIALNVGVGDGTPSGRITSDLDNLDSKMDEILSPLNERDKVNGEDALPSEDDSQLLSLNLSSNS